MSEESKQDMPEVGKQYRVAHSRKGTFSMRVTAVSEPWIDGEITDGFAKAMLDYNVRETGEKITVRAAHCRFWLIPEPPK